MSKPNSTADTPCGCWRGTPRPHEDYRAAWDAIESLWSATLDQARLLLDAKPHEQIDGEWSLVGTHRHRLFACDAWLGNVVLEEEAPYHPLGFPAGGMPPGFGVTARPARTPDRR